MNRTVRVIIVSLVVAMIGLWLVSKAIAWGTCSWYGYQTNREVRYAAFIGCMVKVQDTWIPRNELRVVQ